MRLDDPPGIARPRGGRLVRHAALLSAISFALHFVWENAQCRMFFVHAPPGGTLWRMVLATVGDVAMTWITQVIVAVQSRDWLWCMRATRRQWLTLLASGVVMSIGVEAWAVATGRWRYTDLNPRLPGTGISLVPIVQMLVLLPLTFRFLRRALTKPIGS